LRDTYILLTVFIGSPANTCISRTKRAAQRVRKHSITEGMVVNKRQRKCERVRRRGTELPERLLVIEVR